MVAFAVGGLLGDTLFHLLPEIFLGEDAPEHVRFVLVEPNRNLLLGVAIMVGFVTFVAMDKGLRIATGGEGHSHDHGHGHAEVEVVKPTGKGSALEESPTKSTRSRKGKGAGANAGTELQVVKEQKEINASVKLAGYLNLMCVSPLSHLLTGDSLFWGKYDANVDIIQRRFHAQHHRRPCHVLLFLRIPYHRSNHYRSSILPRNPPRSRRFRTVDPIRVLQETSNGRAIPDCARCTTWHGDRDRSAGIRGKWR